MKGQLERLDGEGMETAWEKETKSVTIRNPARPVWAGGWQAPSFHPAPTACGQDLLAPGGWGDHKALFLAHLVPSKPPLQSQWPTLTCHPQQEPYTHVHSGTCWGPRSVRGWAETVALVDTGQEELTGPYQQADVTQLQPVLVLWDVGPELLKFSIVQASQKLFSYPGLFSYPDL